MNKGTVLIEIDKDLLDKYRSVYKAFMELTDDYTVPDDSTLIFVALNCDMDVMMKKMEME